MLVVIPAHNERENLPQVLEQLERHAPDAEILVVDDGSTDGTYQLLDELGVRWLRFPVCLGVGSAMRAGLRWARLRGHAHVVRVDADGQHVATQLEKLLRPIERGEVDAVHGSRYSGAPSYSAPIGRRLVQRLLAACLSRL